MVDQIIRKVVKTIISCGLVRKRGGGSGSTSQNVLKRKNMQKYFVKFFKGYPLKPWKLFPIFSFSFGTKVFFLFSKTFVLTHSGSFYMHSDFFLQKSAKNSFFRNLQSSLRQADKTTQDFPFFLKFFFLQFRGSGLMHDDNRDFSKHKGSTSKNFWVVCVFSYTQSKLRFCCGYFS